MKLLLAIGLLAAPALFSEAKAATCESLATLALSNATVTLAQPVAAGEFTPPGRTFPGTPASAVAMKDLPAFCRVAATLRPSDDSDIKIEVWLPESGWNGRFEAEGNGGWAGAISYGAMAVALDDGYATASTDTGHVGGSGSFALGHPEKVIDFGWRSEHEMTVKAKAIIKAFYGGQAQLSYWNGCSTGGRQGLKEAQRFPDDYDGIAAGAPANPRTHLAFAALWIAHANLKNPGGYIPPAKYPAIHRAVLQACDALDGLKDGLIADPTRCHFDPETIACKGADTSECLTAPQIEMVKTILAPSRNPRTGEAIFPGLEPGSELGWAVMAGPQPFPVTTDHFKYVVFQNPDWDWKNLNFDSDVALADQIDHETINATDADLKPFFSRNGKLLLYHGWEDQNVAPLATVDYYKRVVDTVGERQAKDSIRLFMAPGMAHCGGGDGPNSFDMMSALAAWRKNDHAPQKIIASRNGRTRPLCPYPQVAKYKGTGSIDDAANFVCETEK
ncbi:MAG: tannase/feruloyl esterase family alpha/beta hydrolase [Bryobacteraceae bacterium]